MSELLRQNQDRYREVKMDEVIFQSFDGPITAIGTEDPRSCSVVLIASRLGVILAHIALSGDAHTSQVMDEVAQIFQEKKTAYFPSRYEIWIVRGMVNESAGTIDGDDEFEMPLIYQRKVIETKLVDMGLGEISTYCFRHRPALRNPAFPGNGIVFVDGKGPAPTVYIGDKAVLDVDSWRYARHEMGLSLKALFSKYTKK